MSGRQRTLLNMFRAQGNRDRLKAIPPQQGGPLQFPKNNPEERAAYNALFAEERRQDAINFARRREEERQERAMERVERGLNLLRNEGVEASQERISRPVLAMLREQGVNASQRRVSKRNRTNRGNNRGNNGANRSNNEGNNGANRGNKRGNKRGNTKKRKTKRIIPASQIPLPNSPLSNSPIIYLPPYNDSNIASYGEEEVPPFEGEQNWMARHLQWGGPK